MLFLWAKSQPVGSNPFIKGRHRGVPLGSHDSQYIFWRLTSGHCQNRPTANKERIVFQPSLVGDWTTSFSKIAQVKLDHIPKDWGENIFFWNHHLDAFFKGLLLLNFLTVFDWPRRPSVSCLVDDLTRSQDTISTTQWQPRTKQPLLKCSLH